MDLNILAYSLAGASVLLSAVDIYDTLPDKWLDGAERLLLTKTGRKVEFARTGSTEEVEAWNAQNGGGANLTEADRYALENEISQTLNLAKKEQS